MTSERAFGRFFDNPDDLFNWINGAVFGVAALNMINRAGVTDRLLQGPAGGAELAALAGVPEGNMGRILEYLAAHEVIGRTDDGHFCANRRTPMIRDAAGYFVNAETSAMAASKLLPGLREGKTPFELHFGAPVFDHFQSHPQMAAKFGEFMGFMTRRVERFLFAQHRFQPFTTVADIGGSMGDLLLGVLGEYPGTRGILFDLPDTIEIARPLIGASPLAGRVELVGGSFFDAVPSADLYTLKQILHDWDDAQCCQILGNIRAAMNPGGRVAVIDHLLADIPEPDESTGTDIAMMVWDTGRERKHADFVALFSACGFRIDRVTHNPSGHSVIEVVPA